MTVGPRAFGSPDASTWSRPCWESRHADCNGCEACLCHSSPHGADGLLFDEAYWASLRADADADEDDQP